MSINPLSQSLASLVGPAQRSATDTGRARVEHGVARPDIPAATPQRPGAASIAAPAQSALPATPPRGTDPELWNVLSAEERTFFAKVGAMGPLTYGRMMSAPSAQPSVLGGRLDIKA